MKKVLLTAVLTVLAGCSKQPNAETNNERMTKPAIAQPVTEEKSEVEQLLSINTLPDVIEMVKPTMSDEFDSLPAAAGVLAFWMDNKHTKIGDIKILDSSTRGKILKDSYNERGKKLCVSGSIVEIQVDRSSGFTAYHAGIVNNYVDATRLLAIGSTGELVANSNATFCGVVIGKIGFNNAAGGTTNAPYLVGMFDLPENR